MRHPIGVWGASSIVSIPRPGWQDWGWWRRWPLSATLSRTSWGAGGNQTAAPGTYTCVVPAGVWWIVAKLWGAGGGGVTGGPGGYVKAIIPVTPGEALTIVVGAPGAVAPNGSAAVGGVPGGGSSGVGGPSSNAASGGGYTALYRGTTPSLATLLLLAGGGGGGGVGYVGGAGGLNAANGGGADAGGGRGATPTAGGVAGTFYRSATTDGAAGSSLLGGRGGSDGSANGAGGGGGRFGGGGGAAGAPWGFCSGAGGGSNYAAPDVLSVAHVLGNNPADPDFAASAGAAATMGRALIYSDQ